MRQNRWLTLILVLAVLLSCAACREQGAADKETTQEVTVSPDDINCFDLVQKKVSEADLHDFLDTHPTVEELNQRFPIECFRYPTVPVWGHLCWATYNTDNGWTIIYFSEKMNYSSHKTIQMNSLVESLEQVEIGLSVDEVEKLDPVGDYWFKYSNKPWVSFHYTEDGMEYFVVYDSSFHVIEICSVLI